MGGDAADRLAEFRDLLRRSAATEPDDPEPILTWLAERRSAMAFEAHLVDLSAVRDWHRDPDTGVIRHASGHFFAVEGVRSVSGGSREVAQWDQPIFTQPEGGILAIVCARRGDEVRFLLQAKAEPGNIGTVQLAPTIQCTYSNLRRAHRGGLPPLGELLLEDSPARPVYQASHNEEGGRFWRKINSNRLLMVDDLEAVAARHPDRFVAASLGQIKALCLVDDVLSPFVKTIIAPL
jgi:oxidase EvaA